MFLILFLMMLILVNGFVCNGEKGLNFKGIFFRDGLKFIVDIEEACC